MILPSHLRDCRIKLKTPTNPDNTRKNPRIQQIRGFFQLVETAGIEPASENRSAGLSSGVSGLLISPGVAKPAKLFRSSPFIRGGYKDELTAHVHCLMTLIPEPQYSPDERAELKSASLPFRQQLIQC